jgi:hypothetical protein
MTKQLTLATDEDIDYSSDVLHTSDTHIRKWMVNVLVEQPMIFKGNSYDNYHKIEFNKLKQVPVKRTNNLRSIPMNDDLMENSTFNKIKFLAKTRGSGDVQRNTSTTITA